LGKHRLLKAEWHWQQQEPTPAIEMADLAIASFRKALELNPQNRIWQRELTMAYSRVAGWYTEQEDFQRAREHCNQAILGFVKLNQTDSQDLESSLRVIEELANYGELSLKLGDRAAAWRGFFTASQDSKIIRRFGEQYTEWGFRMFVWTLAQSLPMLDVANAPFKDRTPSETAVKTVDELERRFAGQDIDWAKRVLFEGLTAERPRPYHEFVRESNLDSTSAEGR